MAPHFHGTNCWHKWNKPGTVNNQPKSKTRTSVGFSGFLASEKALILLSSLQIPFSDRTWPLVHPSLYAGLEFELTDADSLFSICKAWSSDNSIILAISFKQLSVRLCSLSSLLQHC